ncbi:MAG TPA: alpha/beta fold hydrolase, partial [Thermoanaerobaculia bacterium]|nr:alpha/beta fold hydrolase [Thermoanaerobaculia bacterium]
GAAKTVVLAHGAGAPMNTPFMNSVARGLASGGDVRVVRFEFPYMRARRETGRRTGAPDREPVLRKSWIEVVERLGGGARLVIGGKSMGGRIASLVADEVEARGLVCLGYPFHPPGRPDKLRTKHLETLATPALIVQGTRDAFGTPEDVDGYRLSKSIRIEWIEDGDHSFKPRAASGRTEAQNLAAAVDAVREFLATIDSAKRVH